MFSRLAPFSWLSAPDLRTADPLAPSSTDELHRSSFRSGSLAGAARILGVAHGAALGGAVVLLGAAAPTNAFAFTFSKVTDPANPIFSEGGHAGPHYYGASWIDFDQDGDLDLFTDLDKLYQNDGGGQFTRLLGTGLGDGQIDNPAFNMSGVTWGDYDNDGDPDAFVAGAASYLYRNDGVGGFTRITDGAIGGGTANRGWTAAWCDYDNDGNLDLVIVHPAGFVPPQNNPLENLLFRNDGPPNYTFTQITTGPIVEGLDSYTVGTWSDYDDDGDFDFFIGSGPATGVLQPDDLYRNLLTESGIAGFERIVDAPIATELQDGQVWNWIDYDNDGDLDAHVTNWGGSVGGLADRLYRQGPDGSFTAITDQPLNEVRVSLASIWEDFDNDGDIDCYVAHDGASQDGLYENDGDGTFTKRIDTPITSESRPRRGASAGDYDNDGDVDLFVNGPVLARALYRNDDASGNGWLTISVFGTVSNRGAIGAKVRIKATIGGAPVWQRRDISGQNSFNGHSAQVAHFGLGDATVADSVVVTFPSGMTTVLTGVAANQRIRVGEGDVSGAPETGADDRVRGFGLELLGPSPFRTETAVLLRPIGDSTTGPSGGDDARTDAIEVSVHDMGGRRIRTLATTALAGETRRLVWDGRDDRGLPVSAGVYAIRARRGSGVTAETVVAIR